MASSPIYSSNPENFFSDIERLAESDFNNVKINNVDDNGLINWQVPGRIARCIKKSERRTDLSIKFFDAIDKRKPSLSATEASSVEAVKWELTEFLSTKKAPSKVDVTAFIKLCNKHLSDNKDDQPNKASQSSSAKKEQLQPLFNTQALGAIAPQTPETVPKEKVQTVKSPLAPSAPKNEQVEPLNTQEPIEVVLESLREVRNAVESTIKSQPLVKIPLQATTGLKVWMDKLSSSSKSDNETIVRELLGAKKLLSALEKIFSTSSILSAENQHNLLQAINEATQKIDQLTQKEPDVVLKPSKTMPPPIQPKHSSQPPLPLPRQKTNAAIIDPFKAPAQPFRNTSAEAAGSRTLAPEVLLNTRINADHQAAVDFSGRTIDLARKGHPYIDQLKTRIKEYQSKTETACIEDWMKVHGSGSKINKCITAFGEKLVRISDPIFTAATLNGYFSKREWYMYFREAFSDAVTCLHQELQPLIDEKNVYEDIILELASLVNSFDDEIYREF